MIAASNETLITVEHCNKAFPLPDGKGEFTVLRDVNVAVARGEVVALLGRSGSGKSTLLRIMAGLIPASRGTVISDGTVLTGPNPDVGMVFQSFALLPWLTVIENVELGLEARNVGRTERTKRALKAIDLVGLDGFESAYPKELSGGMKQRVGFARALVVEPKVLFLDEPFSALDVLTAENLRGEIDDLWNAGTFPAKSILIVTHNIEEAVFLADRVIVLGANPGRVRGAVTIGLPRPHARSDERFRVLVEYLYTVMTNPDMDVSDGPSVALIQPGATVPAAIRSPYARALPHDSGRHYQRSARTHRRDGRTKCRNCAPRRAFGPADGRSARYSRCRRAAWFCNDRRRRCDHHGRRPRLRDDDDFT